MTETAEPAKEEHDQEEHGSWKERWAKRWAIGRDAGREELGRSRGELTEMGTEVWERVSTRTRAGRRAVTAEVRGAATRYVTEGEGVVDRTFRCALLAAPPLGGLALMGQQPQLAPVAVVIAAVVIWRAGEPGWTEKREQKRAETAAKAAAEEVEEREGEEEKEGKASDTPTETAPDTPAEEPAADSPEPGPSPSEFTGLVWDLLGTTGRGVHLVEVVARLQQLYPGREWTPEEAHRLAEEAGIPRAATRSCTPGRTTSTTGIRRKDMPGVPSPPPRGTPPGGDVAAGQQANNNINNREGTEPGTEWADEPSWYEVIEDPGGRIAYPNGRQAQPVRPVRQRSST